MAKANLKHIFIFLFVLTFISAIGAEDCFAAVADFLCERGIYFYENNDYANALREFKKALLVDPENKAAGDYIDLIEQELLPEEEIWEVEEEVLAPEEEVEDIEVVEEIEQGIAEELAREMAIMQALEEARKKMVFEEETREEEILVEEIKEEIGPAEFFILDQTVRATQPDTLLQIEMEKPLLIEGEQITRFLVILPEMLAVERKTSDQIELKALRLGSTFLHIWDNQGRWTFKVQNIPLQPEGPTLEEVRRQEVEKAENFKIRYSFNRDAYYLGTKPSNLERETLSFAQRVSVEGETPYGKMDSSARIAKLRQTTDLTHFTIGLTDGQLGRWEDFDLRIFDYNIYGSELVFPGTSLRGLRLNQRFAEPEMDYTIFWGREGQGTFGRLSPGLAETKDSFLEGGSFSFKPTDLLDYRLGYYHGHGDARLAYLNSDALDIMANLETEQWRLSFLGGYDTQRFAYTLDADWLWPGLRISTEYRNIFPGYTTIIGWPSRLGETGGLFLLEFSAIENLFLSQRLDVYRDRLYPNPERPKMWNVEMDTYATYRLSEDTTLNANFRYWDDKGKISPRRESSLGAGISQRMDFLKPDDLTIYSNYQYQESKNFNNIANDYQRHRLMTGLRLALFDGLAAYATQEYGWLEEASPEEQFNPQAWEAGLDYYQQVGELPLYGSVRASYRDEKDTSSTYSFLAGEDSFEVQGQLAYRPAADWELFLDGRLRKVWPEDESESVYMEGEFITGGRFLFDSGLTWNPMGDIYGMVFKDVNGDGLRAEDEPGIAGVRVSLGKEKTSTSNEDGRFSFYKIRAKNAYLNLDSSSIPSGFIPSTITAQEVPIRQGRLSIANFGLTFRCEIVGSVFIDANGNGRFDADEQGLENVVLALEDGRQTKTDTQGRYYFRKVAPGVHILSFDVHTMPIHLLPKVAIEKELSLSEGMSYTYNIPMEALK